MKLKPIYILANVFFASLILVSAMHIAAAEPLDVIEITGHLEQATQPAQLLSLHERETVRLSDVLDSAQLPDGVPMLALVMRRIGIDLFNAGKAEILHYMAQAEAGELPLDAEKFHPLQQFFQAADYLSWEIVQAGDTLDTSSYIRGQGQAQLQSASGEMWLLTLGEGTQPLAALNVLTRKAEPVASLAQPITQDMEPLVHDNDAAPRGEVTLDLAQEMEQNITQDMEPLVHGNDLAPRGEVTLDLAQEMEQNITLWMQDHAWLVFEATPHVQQMDDGVLQLTFAEKPLHLRLKSDDEIEEIGMDLGVVTAKLTPQANEQWKIDIQLGEMIHIYDSDGDVLALMRNKQHTITAIWQQGSDVLPHTHASLRGVEIFIGSEDHADTEAYYLPTTPDALHYILIDHLDWANDNSVNHHGMSSGISHFVIDAMSMYTLAGDTLVTLGEARVNGAYEDADTAKLNALLEAISDPEYLLHFHPINFVEQFLQASGAFDGTFTLSDLAIQSPDADEYLRLSSFKTHTTATPITVDASQRLDLDVKYHIENLAFGEQEHVFKADDMRWSMKLHGLSLPNLVALLTEDSLLLEGVDVIQALQSVISGIEFSTLAAGVRSHDKTLAFLFPEHLGMEFRLFDIDRQTSKAAISYRQQGAVSVDDLPKELIPDFVILDVVLQDIPLAALLASTLGGNLSTESALVMLHEHATELELNEFRLELPIAGLSLYGNIAAEQMADVVDSTMLTTRLHMQIRNLEGFAAQTDTLALDPATAEQIRTFAAVLALLGEKREKAGGLIYHDFVLEADAQGNITLNGNDMAPFLSMGR